MACHRSHGLDTRIVRIFNTYRLRMRLEDGRVVSTFIVQALRDEPLTIFGDGSQTRSFCFVEDEIRGLIALLDSGEAIRSTSAIPTSSRSTSLPRSCSRSPVHRR